MKNLKQIIIIVGIILIVASIAGNLYFGWVQMRDKIYERGLQDGAINITQQIRSGVRVTYPEGVILFVPNQ